MQRRLLKYSGLSRFDEAIVLATAALLCQETTTSAPSQTRDPRALYADQRRAELVEALWVLAHTDTGTPDPESRSPLRGLVRARCNPDLQTGRNADASRIDSACETEPATTLLRPAAGSGLGQAEEHDQRPVQVAQHDRRQASHGDQKGCPVASWSPCRQVRICARPGHSIRMPRQVLETTGCRSDWWSACRQLRKLWPRSGGLGRSRPAGAFRCIHHGPPRCRCHLASLRLRLFVLRPVPGDRIDERPIVRLALDCGHGHGLPTGLGNELGRTDVGHPRTQIWIRRRP